MISLPVVCLLAAAVVLSAAAVGVSLFSGWRSRVLFEAADARVKSVMQECEAATDTLRSTVGGMAAQLRDLQREPAVRSPLKPGLNLTKRSQVLRMHRNGDPTDRIAAALDVPRQEVDLLIKVHRVVIKTV